MTFELHPRLAADTVPVGTLPLCRVLLMNDMQFPWCVLVPQRNNIREIHALPDDDQLKLIREISGVSAAMETAFAADKMNVAALGNQVSQLHIHIIARFRTDSAWPAPVWGRQPPRPYPLSDRKQQLEKLRTAFNPIMGFLTTL
ncbi:MAG TPA: HIT family protein [Gammaproteobacteria bacterium]